MDKILLRDHLPLGCKMQRSHRISLLVTKMNLLKLVQCSWRVSLDCRKATLEELDISQSRAVTDKGAASLSSCTNLRIAKVRGGAAAWRRGGVAARRRGGLYMQ